MSKVASIALIWALGWVLGGCDMPGPPERAGSNLHPGIDFPTSGFDTIKVEFFNSNWSEPATLIPAHQADVMVALRWQEELVADSLFQFPCDSSLQRIQFNFNRGSGETSAQMTGFMDCEWFHLAPDYWLRLTDAGLSRMEKVFWEMNYTGVSFHFASPTY